MEVESSRSARNQNEIRRTGRSACVGLRQRRGVDQYDFSASLFRLLQRLGEASGFGRDNYRCRSSTPVAPCFRSPLRIKIDNCGS